MENIPYQHQPLPHGDYIRVLHVDSSTGPEAPVVTFKPIALATDSTQYTAISYTWGDPEPVCQLPCSDGQFVLLSRTLSELFEALSRKERSFVVWIDALSINQSNSTEKARQVNLMGKIYSCAHTVLIWLGSGIAEIERVFRYMRGDDPEVSPCSSPVRGSAHPGGNDSTRLMSAARSTKPRRNLSQSMTSAMMVLLEQPWFRRVWVIQEAILGNSVWVAYGDSLVDFDTFSKHIESIWLSENCADFFNEQEIFYHGLRSATRLFSLRRLFQANNKVPLEPLLEAVLYYQATDSRDFVFAIQGIADRAALLPPPDYTVSTEQVFKDSAENILCQSTTLDLLSLTGLGPKAFSKDPGKPSTSQLPSWVPDFRWSTYNEPINVCNRGKWNAGGILQVRPMPTSEGLKVDAMILDRISKVAAGHINALSIDGLQTSLEQAQCVANSLTKFSSRSAHDIVWRTLIMGMGIGANADLSSLGTAFETLQQILDTHPDLDSVKTNKYYRVLRARSNGWRPFATRNGYFGITHPIVETNDYVCLVPGSRLPLIIRPVDGGFSGQSQTIRAYLVGWCYVDGVMRGEALTVPRETRSIILI